MASISLRRIINCAKALMVRQGFARRTAIRMALNIVARNKTPMNKRPVTVNSEYALEYLQHRNRTMAGAR
jgi:hypothetical protein